MNSLEVSRIAEFCTDYRKYFLREAPHVNTTQPGYGLDRINRMQATTCTLSTVLHTKETLLCILYCLILRFVAFFFFAFHFRGKNWKKMCPLFITEIRHCI